MRMGAQLSGRPSVLLKVFERLCQAVASFLNARAGRGDVKAQIGFAAAAESGAVVGGDSCALFNPLCELFAAHACVLEINPRQIGRFERH